MQTTSAPVAPGRKLALDLLESVDEVTEELVVRILAGDYAYAETSLLPRQELYDVCRANLVVIIDSLASDRALPYAAARDAGRVKAAHGVPLPALLHAFRLAGRLIWERILERATEADSECLPTLSSHVWSVIDVLSGVTAEAYGSYVAEATGRDARARGQQLQALLRGTAGPAQLRDILRTLQLPDKGIFVVVSAESGSAGNEPLPDVEASLERRSIRSRWALDLDSQVGIVSVSSTKDLEAANDQIAALATARVGVSTRFDNIMAAPAALDEAQLAARSVAPGTRAMVTYGTSPVSLLLAALPQAAKTLAEQVMGPLLALPEAERDDLLKTLDAWFRCGGSPSDAARDLHFHRNTVYQRLKRIEVLCGRSHIDPIGSAELYVALQAVRLVAS